MISSRLSRARAVALAVALWGASPPAVVAAPPPGAARARPVYVTAERRSGPLDEVPRSVTVLDGREVDDSGAADLADLAALVGGMHVVGFTARRLAFPWVRGVGAGQGSPAVAVWLDDVPQLGLSSSSLELVDLERVEVIRGPQGTLYGRGALGGAVRLVSRDPGPDLAARAQLEVGDYRLRRGRLSLRGPIVPRRLGFAAAVVHSARRGYSTNDVTGEDLDRRSAWMGRLKLVWTPDARWRLRATATAERARDGAFALAPVDQLRARPHRAAADFVGYTRRDLVAPALDLRRRGDDVDLSAVVAWQRIDAAEASDLDFSAAPHRRRFASDAEDHLSGELRLASAPGAEVAIAPAARLRWQAGLFGFASWSDRRADNEIAPDDPDAIGPVPLTFVNTSARTDAGVAAFGEATATVWARWDVSAGARLAWERREADLTTFLAVDGGESNQAPTNRAADFLGVMPRLAVAWRPDRRTITWLSAERGYRAGGFNDLAPDEARLSYGAETTWTLELGARLATADRRVRGGLTLFWTDWRDLQLSVIEPGSTTAYVDNAGRADSLGAEAELELRPLGGWSLRASVGVADTRYRRYTDPFFGDASGHRIALIPAVTGTVVVSRERRILPGVRAYGRAALRLVGPRWLEAGNTVREDATWLLDLRLGLRGAFFFAEGWARNMLDERWVQVAFPLSSEQLIGENAPPRTVGVSLGARL